MESSARSGASSDVMLKTTPTSSPATTAPGREPMPPTTVTTNDSASTVMPISALTARVGAASTPERPAMAVPMPNTSHQTRPTSMPSTRTISGSREPARMIRP